MSARFSNYAADLILKNLFSTGSGAPIPVPTTYYVALFDSIDGLVEDTPGTQTEINVGGYARLSITAGAGFVTPILTSGKMKTENVSLLNWGVASADWNTVSHIALMDDPDIGEGHVWVFGELNCDTDGLNCTTVDIFSGDTVQFVAGALDILL